MRSSSTTGGHPHVARTHLHLRACRDDDSKTMLAIINSAAEAYRDAIPADCWHEPYMSATELQCEIAAGVRFKGCEVDGVLTGVMGVQAVRNVDLIRHAYVLPACQGSGIGSALMTHLRSQTDRQLLVGTWTAATWAIGFYERHAFTLVDETIKALLLRTYWSISQRQIETSVVLAAPSLSPEEASRLVKTAVPI